MNQHVAIISFDDYADAKDCLKEWDRPGLSESILGRVNGNGSTRLRITIEEIEEDEGA